MCPRGSVACLRSISIFIFISFRYYSCSRSTILSSELTSTHTIAKMLFNHAILIAAFVSLGSTNPIQTRDVTAKLVRRDRCKYNPLAFKREMREPFYSVFWWAIDSTNSIVYSDGADNYDDCVTNCKQHWERTAEPQEVNDMCSRHCRAEFPEQPKGNRKSRVHPI